MSAIANTVGLLVAPRPPVNRPVGTRLPEYAREILRHAGFWLHEPPDVRAAIASGVRVLVLAGDGTLADDEASNVAAWVEAGGALVATGSAWGVPGLFGVEPVPGGEGFGVGPCLLGEGYVAPVAAGHPLTRGLHSALHTFNGAAVRATSAEVAALMRDAHFRLTDRCAVTVQPRGRGLTVFLAPDIPGSVEHIQTGRYVERDCVSAPDHSSPTNDGLLKADDGLVLDWLLDRTPLDFCPHPIFVHAVADELRELLVRAVLLGAGHVGAALDVLWYWPDGAPAVGLISHDSDGNDPALACRMLALTEALDLKATWCLQRPGYPPDVTAAIGAAGHELACHFDAFEQGGDHAWSRTELMRQHAWAEGAAGGRVTGNKNHYTRWEGRLEFLRWCAEAGVTCDQSRGGSKPGSAGFLFGTCHPYWSYEPDGRLIDCLQVGFMSQDPVVHLPPAALAPLVQTALDRNGVAHAIFHPAHCGRPEVNDAMARFVTLCRERGMPFMRACDIDAWERARRATRLEDGADGREVWSDAAMRGATVLTLGGSPGAVERWGFPFTVTAGDIGPSAPLALQPHPGGEP